MIRRTLAAGVATSVAAALLVPWGPAANAAEEPTPKLVPETASPAKTLQKGTALDLGTAQGPETYIVQLEAPAVPTRHLAEERGAAIERTDSPSAYRREIVGQQADLKSSIARITGGAPKVLFSYTEAINGIAVRLTRGQAQRVARLDGVAAVQVDFTRELQTDKGPEWIGAPSIWDGSNVPGGTGTKGEGVVVGILDTGINPANPSFADTVPEEQGGDGYNHSNPLGAGVYKGVCATDPTWGCNDKLIGYWNFQGTDKYDDDGHGSHTASTAAGNQVEATAYSAKGTPNEFSISSVIKGVAPHANIIGYDVCDGAGCQGTSIIAAINQAILDDVDVINYSIGASTPSSAWIDADALGFLNARAAGVHVATSAGNAGPGAFTIGSPGDVPWMTTVGATTHDRKYVSSVTDLASDAGPGPGNIAGAGLSGPTEGAYPLVYAGDAPYNNALCEKAKFAAGTDLTGKIIVCDRGAIGRVEKGENVAELKAEGMVLANDAASGSSLNGDAHALPAAHISHADGVALKSWMASVTGERAALSGAVADIAPENGDIMAAFSSRGPNRAMSSISPSVSAPGVDILAAAGAENSVEWHFISGTSMASPHTAGALALLAAAQPDWTPAEAQSALMTTSEREITDSDGTAADWFDMGSGRIELRRAAKAGLLLDEDLAGYQAADPAKGGDVRALNTASMADDECLQSCDWTRTFTGTATGVGTWTVSVENLSEGLTLSTDKSSIAVTDGGDVDVAVSAEIAPGAATDKWLFGTLVLTPPADSNAPVTHLPVGVLPSAGVLPSSIDITTRRDAGSQVSRDLEAIAITDLQIDASGLVPEKVTELSVVEDSTNLDPYDGNGTVVTRVDVPEGAASLLAELQNPTAPDFDLFVGRGEVSAENEVASSASGGSAEHVEIANPEAGSWWVLVQNWEATEAGGTDTTDLATAVVAGDQGNLRAEGPEGPVPAATPFDIRTFFDESAMDAGETWHGALTLSTAPGKSGDIGVVPVEVHRVGDDVTKTADKTTAAPGDVITYTVEVAPNVAREDLAYTIKDTLPANTTYVDGSATGGATYANGVVSWEGTMESSYGEQGTYDVTSSKQDPSCVNPFTGTAAYFDLYGATNGAIKAQADYSGDSKFWTAFSDTNLGWYGESYRGLGFTDDGFLVYGGADNWAQTGDDEPWTPQVLPNPALPNNVAAGMWRDGQVFYDAAANSGISLASAGGGAVKVIEWDNLGGWNAPGDSLDMQVIAFKDSNDLVWAYNDVKAARSEVTIGTENADGTSGQALINKADATTAITDGTVVCMTYQSPLGDPVTLTYQVKVDDDAHERQVLVNKAVHTVDNPGSKAAEASASVTVKGAKERSEVALEVSPDRIQTGGTTTATATVFSAGEAAPTGTVEFYKGATKVGTGTIGAGNQATATLSGFTTAGTFPVTAKYLGDATNLPSTSAPVNLVVSAPGAPTPKVKSKITVDAPKVIRKGQRAKLKIIVTAPEVTPSGTVKVKVRGAVSKRTYTLTLNKHGIAKIRLAKAKRVGKIRAKVKYSGDAAVLASVKRISIRVRR